MELLALASLNVILTALLTSGAIALAAAILARMLRGPEGFWPRLVVLFAFSLLGFVVGQLMGNSREAAVGAVVPAVLTLIAAIAGYAVGSQGQTEQLKVAALLTTFTFSLLVGTVSGIQLRGESEEELADPNRLRLRELALENSKRAVEVQRLENYIDLLKLQRDFAKEEGLDLSRFESSFEKPRDKKDADDAGAETKPAAPKGKK